MRRSAKPQRLGANPVWWSTLWRDGRIGKCTCLENKRPKGHGGSRPSLSAIFFSIKPPLHMNVILIYYGCCEWKATNDVLWQLGVDLDFSKVLACSHCMTCLGLRCFILSQGNANCDENHSQAHFQMEAMTEETLERDVVVYVRGYCWVVARVGY